MTIEVRKIDGQWYALASNVTDNKVKFGLYGTSNEKRVVYATGESKEKAKNNLVQMCKDISF